VEQVRILWQRGAKLQYSKPAPVYEGYAEWEGQVLKQARLPAPSTPQLPGLLPAPWSQRPRLPHCWGSPDVKLTARCADGDYVPGRARLRRQALRAQGAGGRGRARARGHGRALHRRPGAPVRVQPGRRAQLALPAPQVRTVPPSPIVPQVVQSAALSARCSNGMARHRSVVLGSVSL